MLHSGRIEPSEGAGCNAWERSQRRAVTVLETPGTAYISFFSVSCMCFILSLATDHPLGVHWATWGRESGGYIGMQQSLGLAKAQQSAAAQFERLQLRFVGGR
jgi:hypothetical protein